MTDVPISKIIRLSRAFVLYEREHSLHSAGGLRLATFQPYSAEPLKSRLADMSPGGKPFEITVETDQHGAIHFAHSRHERVGRVWC